MPSSLHFSLGRAAPGIGGVRLSRRLLDAMEERLLGPSSRRIIEGVTAARFLTSLKDLLENPNSLLG